MFLAPDVIIFVRQYLLIFHHTLMVIFKTLIQGFLVGKFYISFPDSISSRFMQPIIPEDERSKEPLDTERIIYHPDMIKA
ncbi:MAG: queuine tRNA-ribosyltransferase containing PUA domain protein, partial [Methanosarcina sp.]